MRHESGPGKMPRMRLVLRRGRLQSPTYAPSLRDGMRALWLAESRDEIIPQGIGDSMCGRYRLSRRKQIIEQHFDAISGEEDWSPRCNIARTQPQPQPQPQAT
jgi:hypothetical protein